MLKSLEIPSTMEEAMARIVASGGTKRVLAGGTIVMGDVNAGTAGIEGLVSLCRLGLDRIVTVGNVARLGACTTLATVERHPALAMLRAAMESIGSPTLRSTATVGGNVCASSPGDLATCLLALDATVTIASRDGAKERDVGAVVATGLVATEIVTEVSFRIPEATAWFYRKAMRRALNSGSIVTIAAHVPVVEGAITNPRVAIGGVGGRPTRALAAEKVLEGRPLTREVVGEAAVAALQDVSPVSDAYASAWYRSRVLPVHFRHALLRAGT